MPDDDISSDFFDVIRGEKVPGSLDRSGRGSCSCSESLEGETRGGAKGVALLVWELLFAVPYLCIPYLPSLAYTCLALLCFYVTDQRREALVCTVERVRE